MPEQVVLDGVDLRRTGADFVGRSIEIKGMRGTPDQVTSPENRSPIDDLLATHSTGV